jgi:hypothetical protein
MNQWVYDRDTDLKVFGLSMLFAISLGMAFPDFDFYNTMFVYVFIDISHSFSTYFYTLSSDRINSSHHRFFFWGILTLVFTISNSMLYGGMGNWLVKLYTIASVYHFMKQSQAWIFIVSKKSRPQTKFEDRLNFCVSYAAVWCPQVMSMAQEKAAPWFVEGDIPNLPFYFRELSLFIGAVVGIAYAALEINRWRKDRVILWAKHFHVAYGCLVWSAARLGSLSFLAESISPLMMMACHSFPYYYLGHRYIQKRSEQKEKFWPYFKSHNLFLLFIWATCLVLTSWQFISVRYIYGKSEFFSAIFISIAVTHYIFDSYLWKKETHPEGAEVFR